MAFYPAIPASDGTSMTAPENAEFKVYELSDTARANPLPLQSTAGLNAAPLVTTGQGVLPPVNVVSPNFSHIFASGEWEWRRDSFEGAETAVKEAREGAVVAQQAALKVQAKADAGEFKGAEGPQGKQGLPGVNAIPASEAVAEYANTPGNPLNRQLKAAFGTHSFMLTPERFESIDNTGARDATNALQSALDSLPYGATAVLYGTYRIKSIAIDPTKFLTIDATAANIVMTDGPTSGISCIGSFGAQVPVSAISTEMLTVENGSRELTKLTTTSATNWRRGDIIKVIADDIIPGAHITSDTTAPRVGEFMTVYSSSGNTVYLQGVLTESFTTNIRAAKLAPGSVTIVRPSCNITDERLANKVRGNMFRFEALIDPKVIGARLQRLAGAGLLFKSCYGYSVDDLVTLTGIDNTDIGVLSYSVQDSSSVDGRVTGGTLRGGRHGFTDGTADTEPNSITTSDYGASMNFLVNGVTVRDMTAACLDTHHNGIGGRFVNCSTYPQPGQDNYVIRGRNHRILNPTCWGGKAVVSLVTQTTGSWSRGETYGIELVNPRSFGTHRIVTGALRTTPNHPKYNSRDTNSRNLTITGGYHEGLRRAAVLVNSDVRWRGHVDVILGSLAEGAFWETQNAALNIDSASVDATKITTIAQFGVQRVLFGNDAGLPGSDIQIRSLALSTSEEYRTAAALPFEVAANTERVVIDDLTFDAPFTAANPVSVPATVTKQSVRWRLLPNDLTTNSTVTSSASVPYSNEALTASLLRLFRAPDPLLMLQAVITDGVARTLSPLPRGKFVGQQVRIVLTTTSAPLTLANGLASNMALSGSTNKVLSAVGDQVTLAWSGAIWRQERNLV